MFKRCLVTVYITCGRGICAQRPDTPTPAAVRKFPSGFSLGGGLVLTTLLPYQKQPHVKAQNKTAPSTFVYGTSQSSTKQPPARTRSLCYQRTVILRKQRQHTHARTWLSRTTRTRWS